MQLPLDKAATVMRDILPVTALIFVSQTSIWTWAKSCIFGRGAA